MQIKQSQKIKNQGGFGVVGALMALMIMSLIIIIFISFENHKKIKESAKTLGNKIAMVVNATEMRLSSDKTFVANTYNLKSLINKTCGGTADDDFLPCGFTLKSDIYNGGVVITVKKSEDGAKTDLAVVETTSIGHLNLKTDVIEPIPYLAGESLLASQAYSADRDTVLYKLDRQKASLTANIVGKNSTNISDIPIGTIFAYSGSTAPEGFFECNGQFYDIDKYPELYKITGTNQVEDLRGSFVRGWDHGKGIDKGRVIGSYQDDTLQNIKASMVLQLNGPTSGISGAFSRSSAGGQNHARGNYSGNYDRINFDASRVARTSSETRPKNIADMYIIKHD
jgi:competence protein ComGC